MTISNTRLKSNDYIYYVAMRKVHRNRMQVYFCQNGFYFENPADRKLNVTAPPCWLVRFQKVGVDVSQGEVGTKIQNGLTAHLLS